MFNRKGRPRVGDEAQPSAEQPEEAAEAPPEEQPAADRSAGPFDITEVADTADYLDLGALLVRPVPGVSWNTASEYPAARTRSATGDALGRSSRKQPLGPVHRLELSAHSTCAAIAGSCWASA